MKTKQPGAQMGLINVLTAIREVHAKRQEDQKNYGDVAKVLQNNPLVAAFFNHLVSSVVSIVLDEIDKRTTPPAYELLDYEAAATFIGKSVGAVRKMKERGQLIPVSHLVHGKVMFTREATENALAASAGSRKE